MAERTFKYSVGLFSMMACKTHSACLREFRIGRSQRENALNRAFHLDRYSPNAALPGQWPYRWEVRKSNLIVAHWNAQEQWWYVLDEDVDGEMAGVLVHIIVMLVQGGRLIPSIDLRKHVQAQDVFTSELLQLQAITYTVVPDDLEQDRALMRAAMDEEDLPKPWKPNH